MTLIYGFTASFFESSVYIGSFFGSKPALVATPLLITDKSTSDKALAACCASTALIFRFLGFDLISLIDPLNPKFLSNLINPALLIISMNVLG